MDKHLEHLIKQTERYTTMLTDNMKSGGEIGRDSKPKHQNHNHNVDFSDLDCIDINAIENSDSDEDFHLLIDENAIDDDTTLNEEETNTRDISITDEIALLKKEGDMPLEELRALYRTRYQTEVNESEDNSEESSQKSNELNNKRTTSFKLSDDLTSSDDDDSFMDESVSEEEDETTLLLEESFGQEMCATDELNILHRESQMSIEDLRAMYQGFNESSNDVDLIDNNDSSENASISQKLEHEIDYEESTFSEESNINVKIDNENEVEENDFQEIESDEDFEIEEEESVDETTFLDELQKGREISIEEEISTLRKDAELSLEELRAKYSNMNQLEMDIEEYEEESENEDHSEGEVHYENTSDDNVDRNVCSDVKVSDEDHAPETMKFIEKNGKKTIDISLERLASSDLAARSVHVERPFILSKQVVLREYQHVGLNWLVSLHERRLNGILADEMVSYYARLANDHIQFLCVYLF